MYFYTKIYVLLREDIHLYIEIDIVLHNDRNILRETDASIPRHMNARRDIYFWKYILFNFHSSIWKYTFL